MLHSYEVAIQHFFVFIHLLDRDPVVLMNAVARSIAMRLLYSTSCLAKLEDEGRNAFHKSMVSFKVTL